MSMNQIECKKKKKEENEENMRNVYVLGIGSTPELRKLGL